MCVARWLRRSLGEEVEDVSGRVVAWKGRAGM